MSMVWILVIVAAVVSLLAFGVSRLYRNPRFPHQRTPADEGIAFEEVRFPTANGRSLYGWWIPAEAGRMDSNVAGADAAMASDAGSAQAPSSTPTLILVHGWGRNLQRVMDYIVHLHGQGFHLLAFDSRNHGSSDRDRFSSMLKFGEDILAAVDFAAGRPHADPERMGVIGLSIGGAAAVWAAAHDPRIRAAVTVGAFAHPVEVMRPEFTHRHVPAPVTSVLFRYFQWRIGQTFDAIAPVNNIAHAEAKFLLVHGDQDVVVPPSQAHELAAAARPGHAEVWMLPGRGHSDCHQHEGFWERLRSFLAPLKTSP